MILSGDHLGHGVPLGDRPGAGAGVLHGVRHGLGAAGYPHGARLGAGEAAGITLIIVPAADVPLVPLPVGLTTLVPAMYAPADIIIMEVAVIPATLLPLVPVALPVVAV